MFADDGDFKGELNGDLGGDFGGDLGGDLGGDFGGDTFSSVALSLGGILVVSIKYS